MFRISAILILVFIVQASFAQNIPCKSYPMSGYRGNCNVTSALSADRKYVYTTDRITLKKWDIATNKVVEEIPGFTSSLAGGTDNPRFIRVKRESAIRSHPQDDLYDLKLKAMVTDPRVTLLALMPEGKRKSFEKTLNAGAFTVYFSSDSAFAGLVDTSGKLYQLEVSTGKMNLLIEGNNVMHFIQEINTFTVYGLKDRKFLVDLASGKKIEFKSTRGMETAIVTPDKKYIVFSGRGGFSFVDRNTGTEVFSNWSGGQVYFKSDQSMFYAFIISWDNDRTYSIHHALTFSYPQFKELERIDTQWSGFANPESMNFDPDKGVFMNAWGGRDIKSREVKVSFSVEQSATEDDLQAEIAERNRNARIGNEAIASLAKMKTPAMVHSLDDYVKTLAYDWTDDGRVLFFEKHGSGGTVIIWSFPGGEPVIAYRDQISTDAGVSTSAVLVPGDLEGARMSPSGKIVGLNTGEGVLFYEGATQKAKIPNRRLLALLDNAAILSEIRKPDVYYYKDLIVVDPQTGKTLGKVKINQLSVFADFDSHYLPGKFVLLNKDGIDILDPANPSTLQSYPNAQAPASGPGRFLLSNTTITDRLTGEVQSIPGYRPPSISDKYILQSTYAINYYANEGFNVYDLNAGKMLNDKLLYPGWMNLNQALFLKGINKLLVIQTVPAYTWPNAKDDDPGASAFTIDITTGEITPYLLTEPRSKFMTMKNAAAAAAFRYASLPCDQKTRSFSAGNTIVSEKHGVCIVMGYDCDINAYVVAKREALHGPNSGTQVSRLHPLTEEEARQQGYMNAGSKWKTCPRCKGYPVTVETRTSSGWSDWEQKSLNIYVYTREWQTKTDQVEVRCERCKGEAWVKID